MLSDFGGSRVEAMRDRKYVKKKMTVNKPHVNPVVCKLIK